MDQENYTNINIFKKVFENREVSTAQNLIAQPSKEANSIAHQKSQFNPYVNNQGTTLGKFQLLLDIKRGSQSLNQHFDV